MAAQARNHHWIPQCYLKGFAKSRSKNAQLFVIDAVSRKTFMSAPRNVASARDFNRVETQGLDANHVESRYADFESLVAPALLRMDETGQFGDAEDHNLVLNLIALFAVRNPRMRENMRDLQERVVKQMMGMAVATEERYEAMIGRVARAGHVDGADNVSYASMREFVLGQRYTIEVPTTRHVESELQLVDTVLPLLGGRSWMLLRATSNSGGFVTSDHPVALYWSKQRDRGPFHSPGFGLKETEVLFPVSHGLAMLGIFGGPHGARDASVEEIALVNGNIIGHSDRQVYARDARFVYSRATGELRPGADVLRDLGNLGEYER